MAFNRNLPILLALFLTFTGIASASKVTAQGNDVQVVLRVDGFDQEAYTRLSGVVGRSPAVTMEYACTWTGVLVLKFTDVAVADRADAMTYTRRLLQSAGIEKGIEFLHVHAEPRGAGKC